MVDGFIIEPAVAVSQSVVMVCDRPNIGLTSIERERGLDLTVTDDIPISSPGRKATPTAHTQSICPHAIDG